MNDPILIKKTFRFIINNMKENEPGEFSEMIYLLLVLGVILKKPDGKKVHTLTY